MFTVLSPDANYQANVRGSGVTFNSIDDGRQIAEWHTSDPITHAFFCPVKYWFIMLTEKEKQMELVVYDLDKGEFISHSTAMGDDWYSSFYYHQTSGIDRSFRVWSPDDSLLVRVYDTVIQLYEVYTGNLLYVISRRQPITDLYVHPEQYWLVIDNTDVFDLESKRYINEAGTVAVAGSTADGRHKRSAEEYAEANAEEYANEPKETCKRARLEDHAEAAVPAETLVFMDY